MTTHRHIMLDLETLGTAPGSVIAAIGAVAFDPVAGELGRTFYRVIDPASAQRAGLTLDAGTVKWWLKQSDAARLALAEAGDPLDQVLHEFSWWFRDVDGRFLWGHGANFDEPMLAAAYRATPWRMPWGYSASRCTRTIFDLADVAPDRAEGVHHNALSDALAQAHAVIAAYAKLGLSGANKAGA